MIFISQCFQNERSAEATDTGISNKIRQQTHICGHMLSIFFSQIDFNRASALFFTILIDKIENYRKQTNILILLYEAP